MIILQWNVGSPIANCQEFEILIKERRKTEEVASIRKNFGLS